MASRADGRFGAKLGDEGFFVGGALVMAAIIVAGFSFNLAQGRSSFSSPLLVHAHAVVFMGWVGLYVLQNGFVATDNIALHRRLGWIGIGWMLLMVVLGTLVTVAMVRHGHTPFFFRPLHFLVFDVLTVLTFAGLTTVAVIMRRQTDWHRRLHFCGMALLLGPALGRLLPMPLLIPWAYEALFPFLLVLPVVGAVADVRRSGRAHPAWAWGIGTMLASLAVTEALAYGPVGPVIYNMVTAGSAGARVAPLAFPLPPWALASRKAAS